MKKVRLIDLSLPLDTNYSVPKPPVLTSYMEIKPVSTMARDARHSSEIRVTAHYPTHVDAPMHVFTRQEKKGKFYIGDWPLEQLYGETVVLDIPKGVEEPHGAKISSEDLEKASKDSKELEIREGDIVLVHTGWGRYFVEDPRTGYWIYYKGPGLDLDAAEWLVKKKIKAFGMDTSGTQWKGRLMFRTPEELDRGLREQPEPVHRILLGNDIALFERLYNLDKIKGRRVVCGFFPMPLVDIEASPIRAIAFLEDEQS